MTDVQATLLELTAVSIRMSIQNAEQDSAEIYVCGGGAYNRQLMQRLTQLLPNQQVKSSAVLGIEPLWVEAMAFAWLAKQTINHKAGNLRAVTGASREVILGGIYWA